MFGARQLLFVTLLSVAALTGHARDSAPVADAKTRTQVEDFYKAWTEAFEKHDLQTLMDMYHPSTRYNSQGEPDKGLAQLRSTWTEELKKPLNGMAWRSRIEEVYADGSLIVVVAIWEATRDASGRPVVVHSIRSVDVLTKSPRGLQVLHTVNYPIL